MGLNKRYVANNLQNLQLIISLPEDNGQATITFNAGYGLRSEAYFITDNEDIQQALEKDQRLNKSYRLEEINNMSVVEHEAILSIENATRIAEEKDKKENPTPKEFQTISEAKKWLHHELKVPIAKLGNKAAVVEKALEFGFELSFLND